ncbi:hypothetical protein EV182_002576 [Spiromyces aspiralis]|uniref:Uncharacterized protein n=1 Tax=Spiromyces aspiralis TaxID=68401 RepID=A0ACC1HKE8_9FUNG|nr:hypothetical protein EV182_002576 [Spiromyces aspiralis]
MQKLQVERSRVSSVLNKNNTNFGKQHLFDGNEETCWNSEEVIEEIRCQFQGGFAAKRMSILRANNNKSDRGDKWVLWCQFHPKDNNTVMLEQGTDFFGRITMYSLEFFGLPLEEEQAGEDLEAQGDENVISIV